MMKDADKYTKPRPPKREVSVLDDDESTITEQPAEKIVKTEEQSFPTPEVIELQKKLHLIRLEGEFQRACRETEKQAMEALEKKVAAMSMQLEEATGGAEEANTANTYLARENDELKTEMAGMRKEHQERNVELTQKLVLHELTIEWNRAKIDELTCRLAQYEGSEQPEIMWLPPPPTDQMQQLQLDGVQLLLQPPQPPSGEAAADSSSIELIVELHAVGHPTNLFQLCRPDSNDSTSFEFARELLRSLVAGKKGQPLIFFSELESDLILYCEACQKTVQKREIIQHFLSRRHYKKVNAVGAAVSCAALQYWEGKLQPKSAEDSNEVAAKKRLDRGLQLHETGHPTNIFQLCHPDSSESISIWAALSQLLAVPSKNEGQTLRMNQTFDSLPELDRYSKNTLHCEACEQTLLNNSEIIEHFLSWTHNAKVRSLGAAVSRAAFEYWLGKLIESQLLLPDRCSKQLKRLMKV